MTQGTNANDADQMELLMRHSSPVVRASQAVISPLAERNSSPSPLRMTRPRSNPRNRTPMRYESPLNTDAFRISEEEERQGDAAHGARRITIRPLAGRAVGTNMATSRIDEGQVRPIGRSRKQGPSQRKMRRWNNDNFVNLAAELHSGGSKAAEVLLRGHANASKYRPVWDPNEQKSKTMSQLMEEEQFKGVRDKFFEGELTTLPKPSRSEKPSPPGPLTPEHMLHRMDARLRRVVVKACENSFPASNVVERLETFLARAYHGKSDKSTPSSWSDILLEPPTVTHRQRDGAYIARFLFDPESETGGFHRLLLHGLCQFHGLQAASTTMQVTMQGKPKQARLLTATGTLSGADVKLVDYVMERKVD